MCKIVNGKGSSAIQEVINILFFRMMRRMDFYSKFIRSLFKVEKFFLIYMVKTFGGSSFATRSYCEAFDCSQINFFYLERCQSYPCWKCLKIARKALLLHKKIV